MRWALFVVAGMAMVVCTLGVSGREVEADPTKDYTVTPEAGAWLICAASYTGPQAAMLAHELALSIRRDFKLPAYLINRGREEREKQREQVEKIRQLSPGAPVRIVRIEEQYAVLVGGYRDMESARRALDDIRKLKPPSNKHMPGITFGGMDGKVTERVLMNPFLTSFVVPNPSIPRKNSDREEKADPFLKELNSGESLSLLQCRKPWTLVVKQYQGAGTIQSASAGSNTFLRMLGMGKNQGELLAASAMQAHSVAEVLRKLGFEAYVLHTRNASIVTVGNFDTMEDPDLQRLQRQLANLQLGTEQMFARPMPMRVPQF